MQNTNLRYFLAANSCQGFVSYFNSCYDAKNGWKAYIIKGGPGTGKSSFMKYVMNKALEKGIRAEQFPCSSDPNSLDAVILPDKKIVIMDGTSPHTVDPIFPGICEQILNFGSFWDSEKFVGKEEQVIALTDKNKLLHKRASRYLQAAGQFFYDSLKIADACTDKERVNNFAKKLCLKYIPKNKNDKKPKEWVRFLSGITPQGVISYTDTVLNSCKKVVIISDEYGSVSDTVMNKVKEYAFESGYDIITVKNCFLPNSLIDGVILPELSLCFIRENEKFVIRSSERRIHARRFVHAEQISKSRKRIKFNKKTADKLISVAIEALAEAKSVHDSLEKYYVEAMDFDALKKIAEELSKKL